MRKNKIKIDEDKIIKTKPRMLCSCCFKEKCECQNIFNRIVNYFRK